MFTMFKKLRPHIGHNIVCVCYGNPDDPADICIECEDCQEVLVSAETEAFEETMAYQYKATIERFANICGYDGDLA